MARRRSTAAGSRGRSLAGSLRQAGIRLGLGMAGILAAIGLLAKCANFGRQQAKGADSIRRPRESVEATARSTPRGGRPPDPTAWREPQEERTLDMQRRSSAQG